MKSLESIKLVQFLLYEQQQFNVGETTGVFGPNGSGKSSALDAVQIAMLGANKSLMAFNAQADASAHQQKRTLRSYCLGQYGDAPDQCARTGAITYITLVWRDSTTREPVSMGVCISASADSESEEVLGRYVLRGTELMLSEHLIPNEDGSLSPMPWSTFRQQIAQKARITGEDPFFDDAANYVRQVLFLLRGQGGQPSYDAFARALRFALRMKFDKSVDQIVRRDVLEDRPTRISRFRSIMDSFKQIKKRIEQLTTRISQAQTIDELFNSAQTEFKKSLTWKALEAASAHEELNSRCESLRQEYVKAKESALKASRTLEEHKKALDAINEGISELERLQSSHGDHQNSAQASSDLKVAAARLQARRNELEGELSKLVRTIRNTANMDDVSTWSEDLLYCATEIDEALEKLRKDINQVNSESLSAPLGMLARLCEEAGKQLGEKRKQVSGRLEALEGEIQLKQEAIERMKGGKAPLSNRTQYLIQALKEQGLTPEPVCDLVHIKDPKWQPVIESYLANNVEALLLPQDQEEQAFRIYRGLQGKRAIYGVKIVRSTRLRYQDERDDTLVASLVQGKNKLAVAYLRSRLGNLHMAEDDKQALAYERSLTIDGMLTSHGDFERLALVPTENLRIGGADASRLPELARQLIGLTEEKSQQSKQETKLQNILTALGGMSSEQTAAMISSMLRSLRETAGDQEAASARLKTASSQDYQEICTKLEDLRNSFPEANANHLNSYSAHELCKRTESDAKVSLDAAETAALHSAKSLAQTKADENLDLDFYSIQWDKLLERHGDGYAQMRSHCANASNNSASAMNRHVGNAMTQLGAYLTEHRAALDDETMNDWRKTKAWMETEIRRMRDTELSDYQKEADDAYEASKVTFRQDVATALSGNLRFMRETFERLNKALRTTPAFTNGERYQFVFKVRPDLEPLLKFINNVADFGTEEGLFGSAGEVPELFKDLLDEKTSANSAATRSPLDDYREFYEFDILIESEDPITGSFKRVGNLSKRIGPGSGGEHRAPLYVIAGAALYSAYRMDKDSRDGLRLILLDEAFDKMDPSNIVATMQYLQELGLQILLASPGENLPTLTAFLDRYFEIQKDPTMHVIEVEERRVSEAMRMRFRDDLWEFHPELLEREIEAIRNPQAGKEPPSDPAQVDDPALRPATTLSDPGLQEQTEISL